MALSQTDAVDGPDDQVRDGDVTSNQVLELLDADYTQAILESIRGDPKSARDLTAECGASRPTVYRRLKSLQEAGLVETAMVYDADGHHRTVFEATVERVSVELTDTGLSVCVQAPTDSTSSRATQLSA